MKPYLLALGLVFCLLPTVSAQLQDFEDIEEVTSKGFFKNYIVNFLRDFTRFGDPFATTGSIGLNMRSYDAFGGDLRQDPFFYTLSGNTNVRVFQVDIPFSVMITARNTESSLPNFNELGDAFKDRIPGLPKRLVRIGFSPRYKWARLHIGDRAMSFSKFTLHNLNFLGGGFELTPGDLRVSGMAGRLAPAEPIDLSLNTPNVPVYERRGWGAKLGYGNDDASIDLILFRAKDDETSIFVPRDNPVQPVPEENIAMGVNLQKLFLQRFRFKMEYALSAVSPNARDAQVSGGIPDFLFQTRNTTEEFHAVDAALDYEGEKFTTGVQVRRVDPNYRTFGAYFFNNDIIDVLGNLRFGLLENKVNVALSAGVQSNNLDNTRPTTTRRNIYSVNLGFAQDPVSINAYYNNNSSNIGYVLDEDLDSLNAVIITEDAGLDISYTLPTAGETQHTFTVSGNLQQVNDDLEDRDLSNNTELIVGNFSYNLMLPSQWRFTTRANFNQNQLGDMTIRRYGAGLGIGKSFLEGKITVGLENNFFVNDNQTGFNTANWIGQLNGSYQISNALSLNLNWGVLNTMSQDELVDPFTELTGNLGIRYNFSIKPFEKKENQEDDNQ
jgi:hypothetical protein